MGVVLAGWMVTGCRERGNAAPDATPDPVSDAAAPDGVSDAAALEPAPILDGAPPALTQQGHAVFTFHSAASAAGFHCRVDERPVVVCTSPFEVDVQHGLHTLSVTAIDSSGIDSLPTTYTWVADILPFGMSVITNLGAYEPGQDITVSWSLPTTPDTIAVVPASNGTGPAILQFTPTDAIGTTTFVGGTIAGDYLVRAYTIGTNSVNARSVPFSVTSACPANPLTGDVTVNSPTDPPTVMTATSISGKLTVSQLAGITLPCLEHVGSVFAVNLHAPRLATIDGDAALDANENESLVLPSLTTIGGTLRLGGSPLHDISSLWRLTTLGGLDINPAGDLSLHGLEGITAIAGNVSINGASVAPVFLGLRNLSTIGGSLTASYNSLDGLQNLTTVGGSVTMMLGTSVGWGVATNTNELLHLERVGGQFNITVGAQLADISLPARSHVGSLSVSLDSGLFFPALQSLTAPMLTTATSVFIVGIASLPRCYAERLVTQISPPPAGGISGLDDAGLCP